jgi:hypothetical protein
MDEVRNALIEAASLTIADHGQLSSWITLDYGTHGHQGFGGYSLGSASLISAGRYDSRYDGFCRDWIVGVLGAAGIERWDQLPGRAVRVRLTRGFVVAIGHITRDDRWFDPKLAIEVRKAQHPEHPAPSDTTAVSS